MTRVAVASRSSSARTHRLVTVIALTALVASTLGGQVCLGGTEDSSLSMGIAFGRAAGAATLVGADIAWQGSPSYALVGDLDVISYPRPEPARKRLAMGLAYTAWRSGNVAVCLTPGIELERIGERHSVRVPFGVSMGWGTTFSDGHGRLGLRLEPFVVYGHESVEMFTRSRGFMNGRTAIVLGYDRLSLGIEHEHAFDNDARWHTRARIGFELRRRRGHTEGHSQRNP